MIADKSNITVREKIMVSGAYTLKHIVSQDLLLNFSCFSFLVNNVEDCAYYIDTIIEWN